ncbi:hypothetical protein LN042_11275 [Kitasatospora sp. RB6PN24]|uniref:hypothetical protein n=1 Tax=Kitasatospora humi TaxID=2893891 RepID=UPI001E535B7C|nr:hypothetical protein [Kitasatospora humi]MCC9307676.1 hypothetical protein [Kitasatospora humi]
MGDIGTIPILNGIRDGLLWGQNPPDFVGSQLSAQAIPNLTWTPIAIDTNVLDSYGGHSTTTNNSRYTCQSGAAGWYTVCGVVAYVPNSSGFRTARIQVNGSSINGLIAYGPNDGTAEAAVITPTRDVFLNAGDYVEVAGWQNSGGSLNTAVTLSSGLWVRWSHA